MRKPKRLMNGIEIANAGDRKVLLGKLVLFGFVSFLGLIAITVEVLQWLGILHR